MAGGSIEGSHARGKGKTKTAQNVTIPDWLMPTVQQGVGATQGSLSNLQNYLGGSGQDLVAGFTPAQAQAQSRAISRAAGEDQSYFRTSRDALRGAAAGEGIDSYIDQGALDTLGSVGTLPQSVEELLQGMTQNGELEGLGGLRGLSGQRTPQSVLDRFEAQGDLAGMSTLEALQGRGVDSDAMDALRRTANGEYLYGGEGFNNALSAAEKAAQRSVLSTFGGSRGAGTGAMAQTAMAGEIGDAFAGLYGQERGRQDAAAQALGQLGLAGTGQQADIASTLGGLDLSARGLDADTAQALADIGITDRGMQADIFNSLANSDLAGRGQALDTASTYGGLAADAEGRALAGADIMASLGLSERGNQLNAAMGLPDVANADIALLDAVGGAQQGLDQAMIDAPIDAQMQLLASALGIVNPQALFGQAGRQSYRNQNHSLTGSFSYGQK